MRALGVCPAWQSKEQLKAGGRECLGTGIFLPLQGDPRVLNSGGGEGGMSGELFCFVLFSNIETLAKRP